MSSERIIEYENSRYSVQKAFVSIYVIEIKE